MLENEKITEEIRKNNFVVTTVMKVPPVFEIQHGDRPVADQSWHILSELLRVLKLIDRTMRLLPVHPNSASCPVYSMSTDGAFLVGLARTAERQPSLLDESNDKNIKKYLERIATLEARDAKKAISMISQIVDCHSDGRLTNFSEFQKLLSNSPSPSLTLAGLELRSPQDHSIALNDEITIIHASSNFPRTLDLGTTLRIFVRVITVDKKNLVAKIKVERADADIFRALGLQSSKLLEIKLQTLDDARCLILADFSDSLIECECTASIALDGNIAELRLLSIGNKQEIADGMQSALRQFQQIGIEF